MRDVDRPALEINHFISFSQISPQLSRELELLAPFGSGNPPPVFASRNVTVNQPRKFGAQEQHVKFMAVDINGDEAEMIWWNADNNAFKGEPVDIAYHILLDDASAPESVSFELIDLRPAVSEEKNELDLVDSHIELIDLRSVKDPIQHCQTLSEKYPDLQVWYESLRKSGGCVSFRSRRDLKPTSSLAILAAPPNFRVLSEIIVTTRPMRIFFFNHPQPQFT
jgi:single-stranded-DNA-specific exonuclease